MIFTTLQIYHMKIRIFILLISTLLLISVSTGTVYKKIIHNTDPQAKCLDGSPAAIYLHEGDTKNILFYFIGGADCAGKDLSDTLEHCYQRSKGMYGSSIYWSDTKIGEGMLSTDPTKNLFANWTKVIFLYCDGAFHQGMTKQPFNYKDAKLYFRGAVNTRSHFQYIHNRYDLNKAERVVLSGSSAGGIATYIWADYLRGFISNTNVKLYSISDSGIFLDPTETVKNGFKVGLGESDQQFIYKVSNRDEGVPNRACAAKQSESRQWFCLTSQGALPYLGVQTLFLQSAYDQYIIRYGGGVLCLTQGLSGYSLAECSVEELKVIEGYRLFYMEYLKKVVALGHNVWSIACSWHAVALFDAFYESPYQKVPMETGSTMQQAIFKYVFTNDKVLDIDVNPWPSNTPCAF